jgi:hypothetical protein
MQCKPEQWVTDSAMGEEYAASLGDARLDRRAKRIGVKVAHSPELSIPKLFQIEADIEGTYRLLRNEDVEWRALLAPHLERTAQRASDAGAVIVAHDTTDIVFPLYWPEDRRQHMTSMSARTQGFLLHASVCITASGPALPLGVMDLQPFVHRSALPADAPETEAFWQAESGLFDNEHARWARGVAGADDDLRFVGVSPIHVMDRETDSYGLLSWMHANEFRFVVRGSLSRKLRYQDELREIGTVDVQLGERYPLRDTRLVATHPTRRARLARLTVRAGVVTLNRARDTKDQSWSPAGFEQPSSLALHLVEAVELAPPDGEKGVRWLLMTTEPIDTADEVLQVIELYRRRWVIEEYFKALKTGCQLEKRQMESAESFLRMLALLAPAAWRLLLLRGVASHSPDARWHHLLTPLEFRVLRAAFNRIASKNKLLPKEATVVQCLFAIAKLGGHLPRNGAPGWQTLQFGWTNLQQLVLGARLAGDAIND